MLCYYNKFWIPEPATGINLIVPCYNLTYTAMHTFLGEMNVGEASMAVISILFLMSFRVLVDGLHSCFISSC